MDHPPDLRRARSFSLSRLRHVANEGPVRPWCVVPSGKNDVTLEIARHAVGIVTVSANKRVGVGFFELRGLPAPSEPFQQRPEAAMSDHKPNVLAS